MFLMSLRENAPYGDALGPAAGMRMYQAYDEPQRMRIQNYV